MTKCVWFYLSHEFFLVLQDCVFFTEEHTWVNISCEIYKRVKHVLEGLIFLLVDLRFFFSDLKKKEKKKLWKLPVDWSFSELFFAFLELFFHFQSFFLYLHNTQ